MQVSKSFPEVMEKSKALAKKMAVDFAKDDVAPDVQLFGALLFSAGVTTLGLHDGEDPTVARVMFIESAGEFFDMCAKSAEKVRQLWEEEGKL